VSIIGCIFLIFFGSSIIKDILKGRIETDFLHQGKASDPDEEKKTAFPGLKNPVVGGIVTSMSNPYWWIWWASIGSAFWVNFNISTDNVPGIVAFFLGHEAGDLAWYVFISFIIFFGRGFINKKVYLVVLFLCGLFMILFGLYLGFIPFFASDSL
ncbi:MAG: LysE family transporter, partial [Spirochaetales bacterium]|nr:LysE family transporter [Spirochaetales bacterium]